MANPQRIQLNRTKGFKLQHASQSLNGLEAVKVDRSTIWGNVYRVGMFKGLDAAGAVQLFRQRLEENVYPDAQHIHKCIELLRGKNLACWCKPGEPCHADVLLELANKEPAK